MHGGFHLRSRALRLYVKRKEGLVSIRTTIQDKTTTIYEYIRKAAMADSVLSKYLRQQKPEKKEE